MPCGSRRARLLLKNNQATIVRYNPFTIQLTIVTGESVQNVTIGVDTGAKHIGIAIVSQDKVLHSAEIILRSDVSELLKNRSIFRRSRRSRNTRYRQARFLNRVKSKKEGWLPPSILAKVSHTMRLIDKYQKLIPTSQLNIEVGNFDIAKINNPNISGTEYQEGNQLGYANVKAFVLARDNHICQYCKGKSRDNKLHVHHIIFRSNGGTDKPDNLITLCETHHNELHSGIIIPKFKKPKQYKESVIMHVIKKNLMTYYPDATFTYGYITKAKRIMLGLEKSHCNDAIAITDITKIKSNATLQLIIQQIRKKKRSLHEATPRKGRKLPNVTAQRNSKNTKYAKGFYLYDKVRLDDRVGWISGFTGSGAYITNIDNNYIQYVDKSYKQVNLSDLQLVHHNNNWRYHYASI